ncbi:hypothetical protein PROFUN_14948 [Planoprotostelium fungivorum]|uniref:Uncharacterized protein n=1 Tax=Planoprotostelium fungivorum TaxID=1890364 RepID=A0A2P6MY88_9EUKA|nr:hypothetical protein PROFUN_14944 [Planoprotostelium fungivorum]PRP76679.1 hypothetical protein PROFUN_14948 [Planoprotostelium fungivorum]
MGGNAIQNSVRLTPQRFKEIGAELLALLAPHFVRCAIPAPAPGKESHGDVDILVVRHPNCNFDPTTIGSKEVNVNTYLTSFEYKGHQIDLITVEEPFFDWQLFMLSFGYVGHLLGMVSKRLGISLSTDGVHVRRDYPGFVTDIRLSADPKLYCDFMGLDHQRWTLGFATVEEGFGWMSTSKFFTAHALKQLTAREKKRRRKRDMVQSFFKWLDNYVDTRPPTESVLEEALDFFGKREEWNAIEREANRREEFSQKFNGHVIQKMTGLNGKKLGDLMKHLKEEHGDALGVMSMDEMEAHVHDTLLSMNGDS